MSVLTAPFGRGGGPSAVFEKLRALGTNPDAYFRSLGVLPKNSEEMIDGAIARVGRTRLTVASLLIDRGLTLPLPEWMGVPVLTTHLQSDGGSARRGQTLANARGENFKLDLTTISIPTYITWANWTMDARLAANAQRVGYPIDPAHVEAATRRVNEYIEESVINGVKEADGTYTKFYNVATYGLVNAPNANTMTFENNRAWDAAAKTGPGIVADIKSMIRTLVDNLKYGPYIALVPPDYWDVLSNDYVANYPKTIYQRLLEISPAVGASQVGNLTIVQADYLPADTVVMFQATSDVIELVVGQLPTNASWEAEPGNPMSDIANIVWSVVVPRVKYDYNLNSGIVIGTPS